MNKAEEIQRLKKFESDIDNVESKRDDLRKKLELLDEIERGMVESVMVDIYGHEIGDTGERHGREHVIESFKLQKSRRGVEIICDTGEVFICNVASLKLEGEG